MSHFFTFYRAIDSWKCPYSQCIMRVSQFGKVCLLLRRDNVAITSFNVRVCKGAREGLDATDRKVFLQFLGVFLISNMAYLIAVVAYIYP